MQVKNDLYNSTQSPKVYVKGKGSDVRLDLQLDFNTNKPSIGASITGIVADSNNTPIANAVVKLTDGALNPLANTTTDSNGNYSFNFFPYSNVYNLIATASGKLLSQSSPFTVSNGQNFNLKFTLQTDNITNLGTLSGTVLNSNAEAISGAIVLLYSIVNGSNILTAITYTDISGIFVFNELNIGNYSIKITALGYLEGNLTASINNSNITTVSKILYINPELPDGIISGVIKDSLDNLIINADVILYKVESDNELAPISVTKTNNTGIYTFINVPKGIYFIKSNQSELVAVNEENTVNSITSITSASPNNLALNKVAVSSANETNYLTPNLVTDGNTTSATSRWSSGPFTNGQQQWIYVDLGQITEFDTVKLYWEVANATIYRIEVSNDATNWISVYRTTNGAGGIETINLTSKQSARYVRIYCEKNNTVISVSLYEIQIYNLRVLVTPTTTTIPINLALNKVAVSSANETNYLTPNLVTDGNTTSATSRWSSGPFTNGQQQWIYVDLGQITEFDTVKLYWEVANATIYRIEVSTDKINWISVYRTTNGVGGIETINLTSKQSARYVRVYCEKNNTVISVSLYEIEIYNKLNTGINIALGKKVYGRNDNKQFILSNVVDGNLNTYWDGGQYPSYLEIDLEKIYSLASINLVNYVDGSRYYNYNIYGSIDGVNFNKIAEKTDVNAATNLGDTFNFNNAVQARYLRVIILYCSANEGSHISELRVYGSETGQTGSLSTPISIQNFSDTVYTAPITTSETINEVFGIIERNLGVQYKSWFEFNITANTNNLDYYEISNSTNGKIKITGNSGVSLATGLNYYLKYFCKVLITQTNEAVNMPTTAPQLTSTIRKECPFEKRYGYNYCTFSYTMAFWSDTQWQLAIDWLALNGINLVLDLIAQHEVWRRFLSKLGYSLVEIKNWLVGPAYIAWEYMDNLSTLGGPLPDQWFSVRTELARKMQRKMQVLGIKNVLQAYYGMIPVDIQDKKPTVSIIPQGKWCAFDRPSILKTDIPEFKTFASLFYTCQEEVYGKNITNYYSADPFMEGGSSGGMSLATIYQNILDSMLAYDNNAIWVVQSWSGNPAQAGLNGITTTKRNNILVLDLYAEVDPRWPGKSNVWGYTWNSPEFDGTPWLWCMLNNFGGRMGIHGQLDVLATSIPNAYKATSQGKISKMKGLGMSPEAIKTNPVLFDLLFEMAWTLDPVNVETWLKNYIERKYGKYTDNSYNAWKVFNQTAYAKRTSYHEGATESIINARPKFGVTSAALVGTLNINYNKITFEGAVNLLLADYDTLKNNASYLFDLADFLRQVVANAAQEYYKKFTDAYTANDSINFNKYADSFLSLIKLQEQILSTQKEFLVGNWIEGAKQVAFDEFSKDMFELNARALITTWGGVKQSEDGGLHDYSNRQWAGLTGDLYYGRWEAWINTLKTAISTKTQPTSIDWFNFDWKWVRSKKLYASEPSNISLKDLGNQFFNQFAISKLT